MGGKKRVCPQCSTRFDKPSLLSKHCKTLGHGFPCPWCDNDGPFPRVKKLNRHCKKVHVRSQVFTCGICIKTFVTKAELASHNRQHASAPAAASTPITKAAPVAHDKQHVNASGSTATSTQSTSQDLSQPKPQVKTIATQPSYACIRCAQQCSSLVELVAHSGRCDFADPTVICSICGQRAFDMVAHMSGEHRKCFACKVTCLDIHTHYELSHPSLFCVECRRACVSERALRAHRRFVHPLGSMQAHVQMPDEPEASLNSPTETSRSYRLQRTGDQLPAHGTEEGEPYTGETKPFNPSLVAAQSSKDTNRSALSTAFLEKLITHFIEEFRTRHDKDLSLDECALQRLRIACESIRDTPWFAARTIEFDDLFDGINFQITFTSSDYKKMWNSCRNPKPAPSPGVIQPTTFNAMKVEEDVAGVSDQLPAMEAVSVPDAPDNNDWEVLSDLSYWSDIAHMVDDNDLRMTEPEELAAGSEHDSFHSPYGERGVSCFSSNVSISPPASTLSIPRMDDVGSGRESRASSRNLPPTPPDATLVLDEEDAPSVVSSDKDECDPRTPAPAAALPTSDRDGCGTTKDRTATVPTPSQRGASAEHGFARTNTGSQSLTGESRPEPPTERFAPSTRFHCRLCSAEPNDPITTLCGHLFCCSCIIAELAKNLKCPVCSTVMLVRLHVD